MTGKVDSQPKETSEGAKTEPESSDMLRLLIKGLLKNHKFLHEYRLQKLVYLAELLYLEREGGKSLTDADYKPYRYGAYSEDVKEAVSELASDSKVQAEYSRKYGNDTWSYKPNGLDPDLPEEVEELVDVVMNLSRHKSSDELAKWSKSTYLFNETDYDEQMSLSEYVSKYLDDGNEPDWKKLT